MSIGRLKVSPILIEKGLEFPPECQLLGCESDGNMITLFIDHPDIPEGVPLVIAEVQRFEPEWTFKVDPDV